MFSTLASNEQHIYSIHSTLTPYIGITLNKNAAGHHTSYGEPYFMQEYRVGLDCYVLKLS